MNPLVQLIHQVSPLSAAAQTALEEAVQFQHLPKNTELLKIGQISQRLYYIQQGLARVYYYKGDVDITDYFAIDQQFIGAVRSLFSGVPSSKGIQLLEDSDVYAIHIQDFERLCLRFHDVERAGRKLAIFAFLEAQSRLESIQFLEAKERYLELGKKYPGLVNRAPLKYIASYLGITQVSLSRIRAEK
jgi:CRP-like cAMP-binding protein